LIARNNPVERLNDIYFVKTDEPGTPFSFFRWLFWNNKIELNSPKGEQIFRHEIFHIRQRHSLDMIFLELLTVVFWINPFFHLIKKEIKAIHEFLADKFAVNEEQKWDYAELLLMQVLNTRQHLVNPFFHNQIKRRIAMITSSSKSGHQYFRKLMVLPMAAIVALLFAFSYKTKADKPDLPSRLSSSNSFDRDTIPDTKKFDPPVIRKVMPGEKLIVIDGKIRGVTTNSNKTFWLEPDKIESRIVLDSKSAKAKYGEIGKYGAIELITKKDIPYLILKDTAHVDLKDWTVKGGQAITDSKGNLHILPDDVTVTVKGWNKKDTLKKDLLVIIDGKEYPELRSLSDIDRVINIDDIQSITILKDQSALVKYHEKGRNGVVEIKTKQGSKSFPPGEVTLKLQVNPKELTLQPVNDVNNKIFEKVEIEPSFPGGKEKWNKYLSIYLDERTPALTGCAPGEYTVVVQFIVRLDSTITNVKALTNHGYGMEKNVINLISKGPKWIPAVQNGRQVVAYKKVPVTFVIGPKKEITKDYNKSETPDRTDPEFMKWRQEAIKEIIAIARKEGI
jgi:hypothetical protein